AGPRRKLGRPEPAAAIRVRSRTRRPVAPMIMILICFLAPWLAMFLRGKVFQGILCIILHLTIIGWIPATIWALVVTRKETA
ncbi:YqaE/Pmp3 family membrane protein, partial [Methylobacterium sp. D53M]